MRIKLLHGYTALIDPCDSHLAKFKWRIHTKNKKYVVRDTFINGQRGTQRIVMLHHCVIGFPLNSYQVDHINGNPLDNRRDNLRIVTPRENTHNSIFQRGGIKTSKYVGVSWSKERKKWVSQIVINRKTISFGRFNTEEEAHLAYEDGVASLKIKEAA